MKKFIFLWLFIFTFQLFAQNKPVALKFDEFSDSFYDRTERFAERMKNEFLSKKAVIIFYNPRKGKYPLKDGKDWAERASSQIYYSANISKDRVIVIDGGYRELATLEFWIVPKDVELPKPTPIFAKSEIVYCPEIKVVGDGFRHNRNNPLKFTAEVDRNLSESLAFEWHTSAGKIVNGQSTNLIDVDLSETDVKKITASVIVRGLPPECDCHAYTTTEIGIYPIKLDEFSHLPYSDIAARMDSYFIQIANEPASTGYIVVYGSRQLNKKYVAAVMKSLNQIMAFRKYDSTRVKIVDGGFREDMMVEVYLIPAGVEPPKPTPTLNNDFVVELKRKIIVRRKKTK